MCNRTIPFAPPNDVYKKYILLSILTIGQEKKFS